MSEAKFTKGPWRVNGDWMIVDSTDRLIAQFEPLNDELSNGNTKESFGNAALIAAAPQMYEMLQAQSRMMHKMGFTDERDAIDLLIAKSRGEQ